MTVSEAIERSAVLYPSEHLSSLIYAHLYELECRVCTQIYGESEPKRLGFGDGSYELRAPDAYADIYPLYIIARGELECGDAERYDFFNGVFTSLYEGLARYARRSTSPQSPKYIKTRGHDYR